jgi:hypothetical protein
MRRVVPRAGIGLLCAAVLAVPALMAGPRRAADLGTGTGTVTVTVFADADATVAEATPDTNAGTATTLQAGASPNLESYLRFIPAGLVGTVTSARLRLWAVDASVDGPALYPTDPGWTETGITWATKPGRTGSVVADLGAVTSGAWVEYDVTSLVHGDGSVAFVVAGQSPDGSDFASRETAANRPELVVATDSTRSTEPLPRDVTIATDPLPADIPDPQAPPAETLLAGPPPADTRPAPTAPPVNPPRDTSPPDTAIASAKVDGSRATFTFTSTETPSTFHCRLDRAAFARCSSPAVYTGLAVGSHTFAVRATDRAANVDPSPATRSVVIAGPPAPPAPAPGPAPGSIRTALLAPARGAWFGYYAQTSVYNQSAAQAAYTNLEAATGRTGDIDHWYEPWGDTFPTWRQPWDFSSGRIPMISWGKQRADVVLSGADDAYIAARADGIKALGKPVFLRWFWEMDFSENLAYSQSPAAYVAAWRHIHAIFTARGATNVAWVWCPNASSFKKGSAQRYYPGDDAVDWICADGYNFHPDGAYREFEPIFASFYAWASQRPKPLMIGEWGDQSAGPGQRAAWLDAAHAALVQKFPRILAVVYFHSNSEHDWTLYDEPDALAAFRRMALDPYFNPPPIYPRR